MKVDYGTREVSYSRYTINIVISDISTEAKFRKMLCENSEEVIVPKKVKTTKLYLGKDLYFNQAKREGK